VSESLSTQCIHNSIGSTLSLLDISIISDTFQIGVQPVYITSTLFATFTKVPEPSGDSREERALWKYIRRQLKDISHKRLFVMEAYF